MPIGSGGFAKFMTNTKQHQQALPIESAALATGAVLDAKAAVFAAAQEIIPYGLIILILGAISVSFLTPQICGCKQFWKNCFTKCRWWYPPGQVWMDVFNFVVNIHWVIVLTRFLYEAMVGLLELAPNDNTYFFGIFMLIMAALVIRYWYTILFFNYHKKWWALIFSGIFAGLEVAACLILTILLGYRKSWIAFGFSFPILVWSIIVFSWTVTVIQCFTSGTCRPWAPKQESKQMIDEQPSAEELPISQYGNSLLSANNRRK